MRAVIQRVKKCSVTINNKIYSEITHGLLVLVCICTNDIDKDINYMIKKIINMRIFEDKNGKFNLSLLDTNGSLMVVSQFTLAADIKKGNRPSYFYAMEPTKAKIVYEIFINKIKDLNINVKSGIFGEKMDISLVNDGPVTIYLDSRVM